VVRVGLQGDAATHCNRPDVQARSQLFTATPFALA